MVDMSNDTHVSDVILLVHELTDLVDSAASKKCSGGLILSFLCVIDV